MKFKTNCGGTIIVPRKTQIHLQAHPEVDQILGAAISRLDLPTDGSFLKTTINMGRIIGRSGVVETAPIAYTEQCLFAQRTERSGPSRVAVNVLGEQTSTMALLAFPGRDRYTQRLTGEYIMITAWIGLLAPMEPWDPNIKKSEQESFQECLHFWSSHALIWDENVMGEPFTSSWAELL